MMQTLQDLRDHLVGALRLDKSRVFTWSDDGSIIFTAGTENRSYRVDYIGRIALTDCAAPLDQVFLVVADFMATRQPHNAGAKPPQFETELLKRNLSNIFLSLPITEIIDSTVQEAGTSLDALVVPPPVTPGDPVTADIIAQHVPGGEPNGGSE